MGRERMAFFLWTAVFSKCFPRAIVVSILKHRWGRADVVFCSDEERHMWIKIFRDICRPKKMKLLKHVGKMRK